MASAEVPGLYLFSHFLSKEDQEETLNQIDAREWKRNRRNTRRIQIYGPWCDRNHKSIYRNQKVSHTYYPPFSELILTRLLQLKKRVPEVAELITREYLDNWYQKGNYYPHSRIRVFINEYPAGGTLRQHYDHRSSYQKHILGVSLGSDATMTLIETGRRFRSSFPEDPST